jgi:nanoRNase/pAp phosphatase (c-di-AMP/oligoRNAs hydrolase)
MQIVTTHKNTDFDALASMVAATILYPDAVPVLPRSINSNIKAFLSLHKDLFDMRAPEELDLNEVTRLIVVDTNSWSRLEGMEALRGRKDLVIHLWDHHMEGADIDASWRCEAPTGATITLLVRQLMKENKLITPIQATLFLVGLYEDTGNLTFLSATADDAHAAAYLLERRADLKVLQSILRPAYGEKQKNILFSLLREAKRIPVNGSHIGIAKADIEGHVGNLAVVVQMYREILNVEAAFGIFSVNQGAKCIVIGRSEIESIDVGAIMRGLGGGGHSVAGSAMIRGMTLDEVETKIMNLIQNAPGASVLIRNLMSRPVVTVSSDTFMAEVASILRRTGSTGMPVMDNGKLVGIISRRDFRKVRNEAQLNRSPVKAFMSGNILTISPDKTPKQAVHIMVRHDIGRLPVIENGELVGIITRSDLMLYFYNSLPD